VTAVTVAVPITVLFVVAAVRAFRVTGRVAITVLSFSLPYPVSFPTPIPMITSFAVAMVLARGVVTFRVTVVVIRM